MLPTRLDERGKIDHRGLISLADVLDERLWVLSDVAFQTLNIDDRDEPVSIFTVEIISEEELLDAGLADCVDSARHRVNPGGIYIPGPGFESIRFTGPCGATSVISLTTLLATLVAMRVIRRRG